MCAHNSLAPSPSTGAAVSKVPRLTEKEIHRLTLGCVPERGICWNVLWGWKCWQEPFLTVPIYCASIIHLMLTFNTVDLHCQTVYPSTTLLSGGLLPYKTWWWPWLVPVTQPPTLGAIPSHQSIYNSQPSLTASCIRDLSHHQHSYSCHSQASQQAMLGANPALYNFHSSHSQDAWPDELGVNSIHHGAHSSCGQASQTATLSQSC